MPIETKKLEGKAIVIATYAGHISAEEVEQMYQETERLFGDIEGKYYRISDVREADTNFPDFIKITMSLQQVGKFRTLDPDMKTIFVGTNNWIHNYRNMAQQRGVSLPAFQSMEDAMAFIELDMAEDKDG